MAYNVKELRDNLVEKVIALGISEKFKDNPAFSAALTKIVVAISRMNMGVAEENVQVNQKDGKISFSWTSEIGYKYSMTIECHNPETFTCTTIEEEPPYLGNNGQRIIEKTITEDIATINERSGFITLTTNGASINNVDCNNNQHNTSTWATQAYYTPEGVMRDRKDKIFAEVPNMFGSIERAGIENLIIPREAFSPGSPYYDNYEIRQYLQRERLDTARVILDNRKKGIKYNATLPLNEEHGLRDMFLRGGYNPYPKEVIINPLSTEEIEVKLKRESNPKVAEGLRIYAEGKHNYYYHSQDDPNFVAEGISELQEMMETNEEENILQTTNSR